MPAEFSLHRLTSSRGTEPPQRHIVPRYLRMGKKTRAESSPCKGRRTAGSGIHPAFVFPGGPNPGPAALELYRVWRSQESIPALPPGLRAYLVLGRVVIIITSVLHMDTIIRQIQGNSVQQPTPDSRALMQVSDITGWPSHHTAKSSSRQRAICPTPCRTPGQAELGPEPAPPAQHLNSGSFS